MRKSLMMLVMVLPLAGCQTISAVTSANNALAGLAGGDIPKACGIIAVAEGYYANVKSLVPVTQQRQAAAAEAAVGVICKNPPTNVVSAFDSLMAAWTAIQAATTVP
jgi:hypothetical protein